MASEWSMATRGCTEAIDRKDSALQVGGNAADTALGAGYL